MGSFTNLVILLGVVALIVAIHHVFTSRAEKKEDDERERLAAAGAGEKKDDWEISDDEQGAVRVSDFAKLRLWNSEESNYWPDREVLERIEDGDERLYILYRRGRGVDSWVMVDTYIAVDIKSATEAIDTKHPSPSLIM